MYFPNPGWCLFISLAIQFRNVFSVFVLMSAMLSVVTFCVHQAWQVDSGQLKQRSGGFMQSDCVTVGAESLKAEIGCSCDQCCYSFWSWIFWKRGLVLCFNIWKFWIFFFMWFFQVFGPCAQVQRCSGASWLQDSVFSVLTGFGWNHWRLFWCCLLVYWFVGSLVYWSIWLPGLLMFIWYTWILYYLFIVISWIFLLLFDVAGAMIIVPWPNPLTFLVLTSFMS